MRPRTRLVALAAVAALALAAIVLAARGGGAPPATVEPAGDGEPPDSVQAQIDRALGREGRVMPAPAVAGGERVPGGPEQAKSAAAPVPAAQDGAGSSGGDALASTAERKIVQTASMRLQVKEVGAGFEEVGRIATAAGGFVASSSFSYQGEQQVASVTIRVPASRYQDVLSQVRALGVKVDSEASNASDVTEEYSDLSARLRNLEATEAQLLQLLGQARNINEVLQVQDRLSAVRAEVERVKGRIVLLEKLSEMATLTVHLRPAVAVAKADGGGIDIGREVSEAWEASLEFLGGIAAGVVAVVVFAWWTLPLAVLAWLAWQRWSRPAAGGAAPEA
jgi:hypothetical protein